MLPHASGTSRAARGKISPAWRRTGTTLVRGEKNQPCGQGGGIRGLRQSAKFLAQIGGRRNPADKGAKRFLLIAPGCAATGYAPETGWRCRREAISALFSLTRRGASASGWRLICRGWRKRVEPAQGARTASPRHGLRRMDATPSRAGGGRPSENRPEADVSRVFSASA